MGERKFRPVDAAAAILGLASLWMMIRGGFAEFTALHAWGLAMAAVALGVAMWAMGTCIGDRITRRMEERIGEAVAAAIRDVALEELRR